jgi:ABC-2 type transport system ATP-binding protein
MSVEINHLTKQYGEQKAVNDISFQAKKGEVLGFLGPNGAGKSTTMKIATCFLPPTSGEVKVSGIDVTKSPKAVRKVVGYLPEHNPLYLDMYVHEYLQFIGSVHGMKGRRLADKVASTVAQVGLEREQKKKIGALSKGYRQRVGLGQAILHEPEVLILDEPTTGLDPNQIVEIRELISQESKDKTVILSTHIMQEVQALCDRVVIINRGNIVADDPVEKLKQGGNETTVFVEFESEIKSFEKLQALEWVSDIHVNSSRSIEVKTQRSDEIRGDIFRFAVENDWVILGMSKEVRSLENVFQELTQG